MSSSALSSTPTRSASTASGHGREPPKPSGGPCEMECAFVVNAGARTCNVLVFFPILLSFYIPFLLIFCYAFGLHFHHFHFALPLVSDTGNYKPEAAIFCFAIIHIGILFLIVAIIRFLQLRAIIRDPTFEQLTRYFFGNIAVDALQQPPSDTIRDPPLHQLMNMAGYRIVFSLINKVLFMMGIFISLSCMATGCFRFAESFMFHNLSAGGVFVLTPMYMIGNTYLSGVWGKAVNSIELYRRRLWISVTACALFFGFGGTIGLLTTVYSKQYENPVTRLFWSWNEKGYLVHLFNSMAEWLFLLTISPFAYTFAEDFSRLRMAGLRLAFEFYPMGEDGLGIGDGIDPGPGPGPEPGPGANGSPRGKGGDSPAGGPGNGPEESTTPKKQRSQDSSSPVTGSSLTGTREEPTFTVSTATLPPVNTTPP